MSGFAVTRRARRVAVCLALGLGTTCVATHADPHRAGVISSINAGLRYSSVMERRGVVLYDGFQIDPVLTVFLFDDRVEFLGDSIGYRDFVAGDWLRFRTRLQQVSDDPLFPDRESAKQGLADRPDTVEWVNGVEWFVPGYNPSYRAEIDLSWARDVDEHQGSYIELVVKQKIAAFDAFGTRFEPDFYASAGWGDDRHNRFFYGPDDRSGFSNYAVGLWLALPDKVDRHYPNLQLKYFGAAGSHDKRLYSRGHSDGVLLSFITAIRLR